MTYAIGGTAALFGFGPHSMITSVFEIAGAAPFALGYVLLGRTSGQIHRSIAATTTRTEIA